MGDKVKEVGGGAATGLGDDFARFLQQGLYGSYGAPSPQQSTGSASKNPFLTGQYGSGKNTQIGQTTPATAFDRANPVGSTMGVANGLNKFINGDFGATNWGTDLSGLKSLAGQGGFDFGEFNPQSVDFSQFNTNALKNFTPNINPAAFDPSGRITGNSMFQAASQFSNPLANLTGPESVAFNLAAPDLSPYLAELDRQKMKDVANLRARFTANGGLSFGTPAAFAEGNYLAETNAKNAATLADIGRQQQMLDLQRQSSAAGINAQNLGSYYNALGRGGELSLGRFSTIADSLSRELGASVDTRGQDINAMIASGQLSLDALSKATGLDLESLKAASAQGMDLNKLGLDFKGMQADDAYRNRALDADIYGKIGNLDLSGQEIAQRDALAKLGLSADVINSILNMTGNIAGRGISQRQVVQQPGVLSNVLGTVKGIAGLGTSLAGINPFGGSAPNVSGGFNPVSAPSWLSGGVPELGGFAPSVLRSAPQLAPIGTVPPLYNVGRRFYTK